MLSGIRILLVISGGIAAYKSLELIRRLRERGAAVRCILTRGGREFVTPLSLAALSEDKVYEDLFSLTDESEMGHIRLSREAELISRVVVADDHSAFGKLVQIHQSPVRQFLRRLTRGDPERADDLAQEVWVRALQEPSGRGRLSRAWFSRVLRNLVVDNLRRDRRRRPRVG